MSIFKRLTATLTSRIDQVVGEIENHDAVVQASIAEQSRRVAQAKVRLAQVQREATKLSRQLGELSEAEQRWGLRAVEAAGTDEAKALECMRRRKLCRTQMKRIESALEQYQGTLAKLGQDIAQSEEQLREMKQRHQLMRARQCSTEALSMVSQATDESLQQMDDAFDRWDILITQQELSIGDPSTPLDLLEQEFSSQEEQESLRSELATLMAKESGHAD